VHWTYDKGFVEFNNTAPAWTNFNKTFAVCIDFFLHFFSYILMINVS
jgi:hypothetical protein